MTLAADEGGKLVAALAAAPGFARVNEPATPVLLWSLGSNTPVWASPAGRTLLARLPTALDGTARIPPQTLDRLAELARGLAPRSGMRLERLRWGRMEAPLMLACRLVQHGDAEYLLTAILPPPVSRAGRADAILGEPRSAPAPSQPVVPVERVPTGPRSRGRRFAWQADAEGRFLSVSDELAEIVGPRGARVIGFDWQDLVGRVVDDPDGAVGRAWSRGESWSRATIGWRDPDREKLVPVEFNGAPVPSAGEGRTAYRGFGIIRADEARPVAPGTFMDLPEPRPTAPETASDQAPPEQAAPGEGPSDDVGPDAGTSGPGPTMTQAMDAAAILGTKTGETMFNMLRVWLGPPTAPATPSAEGPVRDDLAEGLTSTEQGALHEIARTLRSPGAEAPEPGEVRPTADIVHLPARPRRPQESTRLLDQLPVGIVVMRETVPIFANRDVLRRLGFTELPDAVAKGTFQGLSKVEPDDVAPATVSVSDAAGKTHTFEARAARVEWGERDADLVLLTPASGAPSAAVEALRLHLEARERRLEETNAALELAADGIVTLDRTARLLSLNRAAERLFGVMANEVVGDSITALIDPRDHRVALACLDALRIHAQGAAQSCEISGRTSTGETIPLAMRAGHTPGDEGGFSVAFSDITHFRLMEQDLRGARESAEEASANRADFLARISHEVRTPLTAITGFADLMLDERFGPLGNERYKGYVGDIRESGIHVLSLVNDLLDLAKATSGSEELDPVPIDLNAVLQLCVGLSGPLAGREKVIIRTSYQAELPRAFADERSVRQIVTNLLSNAIRFAGAGGQVIVSTAIGAPGEAVLSVRDTGPGMSADEVVTALTPFRQVANTRRGDGTGLGLPLSKALTEANGGVFLITSARDLGTLIEVRLPIETQGAVAAE